MLTVVLCIVSTCFVLYHCVCIVSMCFVLYQLAPENTIEAFRLAASEPSVITLESDVTVRYVSSLLLLKYFIYNTSCYKKGSTSKKSLSDHLISIVDLTISKNTCK